MIYQQLKDKYFEIVSLAQATNGVLDAGPGIIAAHPTYTVLIDEQHLVSKFYNVVNIPTGVWIDEHGKIVGPIEVAFANNQFKDKSGHLSEAIPHFKEAERLNAKSSNYKRQATYPCPMPSATMELPL